MKTQPKRRKATTVPSFYAYAVREPAHDGDKAFWTRIGTAFPHAEGGHTIVWDAHPMGRTTVLRVPLPSDDA